jgi:hypothetical protein
MEYFGRNLFVMNILQAIINRKPLKTKELSPGNGEGGEGSHSPGDAHNEK